MLDPGTDSPECWNMSAIEEPTILALEAAGNACSAALWAKGAIAARRWEAMARGHAEMLVPMAEAVVAETGFADLDLVAVSTGPGAYTGLRIAISAARGLGLALGVPVMGIGSLDAHLYRARDDGVAGPLAVLLETKRADFYVQAFAADDAPLGDPAVMDGETAEALLRSHGIAALAGDAVERFAEDVPREQTRALCPQDGDAAVVAALAARALAANGSAEFAPPSPMYLRAPDTSPPTADRQILRG